MALRIGIGDTMTLCKSAIDLCNKALHEEHEDSRTMVAGMCLVRSHLQSLSKQIGDEKEFVASRPDIAPTIQRSLAPIHQDLSELKLLLQSNAKHKPSLHIADQVCYHVLYKAKLARIQERMPSHRKSISEIGTLMEAQTYVERRASIARLGTLVEEHEERRREAELAQIDEVGRLEGNDTEVSKLVESIRNAPDRQQTPENFQLERFKF